MAMHVRRVHTRQMISNGKVSKGAAHVVEQLRAQITDLEHAIQIIEKL